MMLQIKTQFSQLPLELQLLIDPSKPLRHPDRFFAAPLCGGLLAYSILIGCVFLCFLLGRTVIHHSWLAFQGSSYSGSDLTIGLAFFLVMAAWAVRQLRLIRIGRQQRRQLKLGQFRGGWFFGPDYVLEVDRGCATVVPRNRVTQITTRAPKNVESGARALGTYIDYLDDAGVVRSMWVHSCNQTHRVKTWHRTGDLN